MSSKREATDSAFEEGWAEGWVEGWVEGAFKALRLRGNTSSAEYVAKYGEEPPAAGSRDCGSFREGLMKLQGILCCVVADS